MTAQKNINEYNEKTEKEILEETKEFANCHNIHYDDLTESMILNAMRAVAYKFVTMSKEQKK